MIRSLGGRLFIWETHLHTVTNGYSRLHAATDLRTITRNSGLKTTYHDEITESIHDAIVGAALSIAKRREVDKDRSLLFSLHAQQ